MRSPCCLCVYVSPTPLIPESRNSGDLFFVCVSSLSLIDKGSVAGQQLSIRTVVRVVLEIFVSI
jgi:hypothetical protein